MTNKNSIETTEVKPIEIACPDCYGGHFKPCNICGDSGVVLWIPNTTSNGTQPISPITSQGGEEIERDSFEVLHQEAMDSLHRCQSLLIEEKQENKNLEQDMFNQASTIQDLNKELSDLRKENEALIGRPVLKNEWQDLVRERDDLRAKLDVAREALKNIPEYLNTIGWNDISRYV